MHLPQQVRTDLEAGLVKFFHHKGFTLHKCCIEGRGGEEHMVGGLCLTPEPDGTVLVGWALNPRHDHYASFTSGDEFRSSLLGLLRQTLERADYPTTPGPLGTTVRVLGAPDAVRIELDLPV